MCLKDAGLQLNLKKCHLATRQLTILAHVVSKDSILPEPAKLRAVTDFPKTNDNQRLKELRRALLLLLPVCS